MTDSFLSDNHLDQRNQTQPIRQVCFKRIDPHVGHFEMFVAPTGERILLDLFPRCIIGQIALGGWDLITIPVL